MGAVSQPRVDLVGEGEHKLDSRRNWWLENARDEENACECKAVINTL